MKLFDESFNTVSVKISLKSTILYVADIVNVIFKLFTKEC